MSGPGSWCCKLRVHPGGRAGAPAGREAWLQAGTPLRCPGQRIKGAGSQGLRPGSCPDRGRGSLQGSPFSPPAPQSPPFWVHVGHARGRLWVSLLSLARWGQSGLSGNQRRNGTGRGLGTWKMMVEEMRGGVPGNPNTPKKRLWSPVALSSHCSSVPKLLCDLRQAPCLL